MNFKCIFALSVCVFSAASFGAQSGECEAKEDHRLVAAEELVVARALSENALIHLNSMLEHGSPQALEQAIDIHRDARDKCVSMCNK